MAIHFKLFTSNFITFCYNIITGVKIYNKFEYETYHKYDFSMQSLFRYLINSISYGI